MGQWMNEWKDSDTACRKLLLMLYLREWWAKMIFQGFFLWWCSQTAFWSQSETERPQKWAICVCSSSSKSSFSKCVLSTYHMLETWEDLLKERTVRFRIFLNPQMDIRSSVHAALPLILGPLGTVLGSGSPIETYIYQT